MEESMKENMFDTVKRLLKEGRLEAMQLCDLSHKRLMYDIVVFMYRTNVEFELDESDKLDDSPYIILDYVYGAANYPNNEPYAILDNMERIYKALKHHNLI